MACRFTPKRWSSSSIPPAACCKADASAPRSASYCKRLDGLTDDAQFSVLAFNGEVYAWRKQLTPANAAMKEAAQHWVASLETANSTASYDALEAGLQFDAEAIFFLTDGVPQGGNINNPADIVALITRPTVPSACRSTRSALAWAAR